MYSSRNPLLRRYFWSRLRKMAQVAQSCNPLVMLDIGCGKGELLQVIAKRPPGYEYVGIDIGGNLNEAKSKAKLERMENTQFLKADCTLLPLRSNSSQLVFCASILEHLPDVPSALSELERVLEIDGKLVVGVPSENHVYHISRAIAGLQRPSDHYHKGAYLATLLAGKFPRVKSATLPFSFLPRSLSLYSVLVCGKGSNSGNANRTTS
jgi:ubiquinone/menaquinone biosynthesis C-methylase UbiE